jgi:hypothetical protein
MRTLFLAVITLIGLQIPGVQAGVIVSTDFDLSIMCPGCAGAGIPLPSNPILLETTFWQSFTDPIPFSQFYVFAAIAPNVSLIGPDDFAGNSNFVYYPTYPTAGGPLDDGGLAIEYKGGEYLFYCNGSCFVDYVGAGPDPSSPATFSLNAASTPLPASLPLLAGGLSVMGLLGWRRKRKNAAAIAAA